MFSHDANYTNVHEEVNTDLHLTDKYSDSHNQWMDCIDWINDKLKHGEVTQEELRQAVVDAGFAKTTQPTISRILTHKTPNPGYKTINAIIRACGGDPDSYMHQSGQAQQTKPASLQSASLADLSEELARRLADPGRKVANGG